MSRSVDLISRKTNDKTVFANQGNIAVPLQEPSVILVHASPKHVIRYEYQGNDLLIYMEDGSVIRCTNYFTEGRQSVQGELLFEDETGMLTRVTFDPMVVQLPVDTAVITPTETYINSVEALPAHGGGFEWGTWGMGALAVAGGVAVFSDDLFSSDDDDSSGSSTATITPTFTAKDTTGDSQGTLADKDKTDELTPTFSGNGAIGATIQIQDSSGNVLASATVGAYGTWSVKLPTQELGTHTYSVKQVEGSTVTAVGDITLTMVDIGKLAIDPVTGDNLLNAAEVGKGFSITGTSTNMPEGTIVTVSFNGKSYKVAIDSSGKWEVPLTAYEVSTLATGNYELTVSAEDAAGNTTETKETVRVELSTPTLTLDAIAHDNIINAAEAGRDPNSTSTEAFVISGTSNAGQNQKVTVTFNGKEYTATLSSTGNWSIIIPEADLKTLPNSGSLKVSVTVSDSAGNSATVDRTVTVDTVLPTVTIHTIAGDNNIDSTEMGQAQIISGTATDVGEGDVVKVTLNGKTYTTTIQKNGSWQVGVSADDLKSLTDPKYTVEVSITDSAGNVGKSTVDLTVGSLEAPTLELDPVAHDNIINAAEAGRDESVTNVEPLLISGSTDAGQNQIVTVVFNSVTYTATVSSGGLWSVIISDADIAKFPETGDLQLKVSVTGINGKETIVEKIIPIDTQIPEITINSLGENNHLTSDDLANGITISGSVTGAAEGDSVVVTFNSKTYTATVDANLTWKVDVTATNLASVNAGNDISLSVKITDAASNVGSATSTVTTELAVAESTEQETSSQSENTAQSEQASVLASSETHVLLSRLLDVQEKESETESIHQIETHPVVALSGTGQVQIALQELLPVSVSEEEQSIDLKVILPDSVSSDETGIEMLSAVATEQARGSGIGDFTPLLMLNDIRDVDLASVIENHPLPVIG